MRIGVDIRALMEGKITGVQVYILNLLEALFEIDKKNEYVLFANAFTPPLIPPLMRGGWGKGRITTKFYNYPNKLFIPAQKYVVWPKVDKLLGGIDLFFSPHWRITALSKIVPLIVTFHDLSFEVAPEFFTRRQRYWHKFMDYRRAASRATRIIAVSESTKRDLAYLYKVPESKISVVYPGIDPRPQPLSQREKVSGRSGEDYFLYFGTFEPRKNVETVLSAYDEYYRLSTVKRPLVLAGSAGWKTSLKIPEKLKHKISVYREVSDEQKNQLYRDGFAFLFLSFYEGFGFPVLEAATAGLPVILSLATSLHEIGHEFALFVNPFRSRQVAKAMLELEEDHILYQDLKQKGLQAVKKYSWSLAARKTLEIFRSVII